MNDTDNERLREGIIDRIFDNVGHEEEAADLIMSLLAPYLAKTVGEEQDRIQAIRDGFNSVKHHTIEEEMWRVENLISLLGKIPKKEDKEVDVCLWEEDEDGYWETSCHDSFCFIEGGLVENKMRYCPYCGRAIKQGKLKIVEE